MLLSILIPHLNSRSAMLLRLLASLRSQMTSDVEIIRESDDGQLAIGTKRNRLLRKAKGDYVCFVDDDDSVAPDYVSCLLAGIAEGVDAVCIQGIFTFNGQEPSPFVDVPYQRHEVKRLNGKAEFKRGLQHLDAIKREIACSVDFPETSYGEDYEWGTALERTGQVKTWKCIDHPVYFYDSRYPKERRFMPDLAIVMPVFNHIYITQKSVESLFANTLDKNFIFIMVDDASTDDTALYARELGERYGAVRFHYHKNRENLGVNASWNVGIAIAQGRGVKNIAVVNNDVLFSPNWDAALIKSLEDHDIGVISPLSTYGRSVAPDWPKGRDRNVNPAGYLGYMPILGACFVARARVFMEIGPFPEELKYYFGDNWLVAAVQAKGYQCGYDNESYVHHLIAITTAELENGPIWEREGPIYEKLVSPLGGMRPMVEAPA